MKPIIHIQDVVLDSILKLWPRKVYKLLSTVSIAHLDDFDCLVVYYTEQFVSSHIFI